ncbi:S8 family peptidase [Tuberibacillus sp. Marseille-P3662]|uniref:S8 family peptidase n=1 Tax=Tuberibacillus sp. Marseille-P3662 TaxID=1965358 RepID=UPI000A1CDC4A|nr:S8 family peptidase [Tuberibacillus sp. Marseille-P3662]
MYGFSMIQLTRKYHHKFDKDLRQQLVQLYRPFRRIPCFMHRHLEKLMVKFKKLPVVIELEEDAESFHTSKNDMDQLLKHESRCKISHDYPEISCLSATLTPSSIEKLIYNHPNIKKVYHDRKVSAYLDVASPTIRAQALHDQGLTGKNVNIAVVDTGVHPHTDLKQPTDRIVAFKDFVKNKTKPYDDNGHGTHCAGDAAGNGYASDGNYRGPAPEAGIIGVKVLDQTGSGSLSTVAAGIQWCIEHKAEYQIDIISLSLGAPADQSNCNDPLVKMVDKAWANGIVVCVAAGNSGPDKRTIGTPGNSSTIITVGAMDDQNTVDRSDDEIAPFSSRGPACGQTSKPDVVTPGVNIISLRSPSSYLDKTQKSNRVDNDYFSLSGTSMATPICAGACALILESSPEDTPDQVKTKILQAAVDQGLPKYVQGAGYLDVSKAIE